MKNINKYILEKFKISSKNIIKEKPIDILVKYFREILLRDKDHKFNESDFIDYKTGMFELYDSDDNNNIFYTTRHLEFLKKLKEEDIDNNMFQYDGDIKKDGEHSIGIIGHNETCLTLGFIDSDFKICPSIKEINVSKDIKDILLKNK